MSVAEGLSGTSRGVAALCEAIRDGDMDACERMLCDRLACVRVNAADRALRTPLHHAAAGCGDSTPQLVELLVRHGADIHARDKYGEIPLHRVNFNMPKSVPVARALLEAGTDVNAVTEALFGMTTFTWVIFVASTHGIDAPLEFIESLIVRHGADVNAADRDLRTPLHRASAGRSDSTPKLLKLLVRHGANVHARDRYGNISLHMACGSDMIPSTAAVQALLAACTASGRAGSAEEPALKKKA